jgi:hypothetical protein
MSKPIPKMKYWQIKAPNEINQEMLSNLPKSKYFIYLIQRCHGKKTITRCSSLAIKCK